MASIDLPPELPTATKTLTAQCYCKATHFTITIPSSALPLPVHLCHCSICRQTHGTLSSFHAPLPAGIEPTFIPPSSLAASLTGYLHSPSALSTRYFCRTCGCHVGDADTEPDPQTGKPEWRVATSVFDSQEHFRIRSHVYTRGHGTGLHDWLPRLGGGEAVRVWNPDRDEIPSGPPPLPESDAEGNERLRAECRCGGVSFTIPRPNAPGVEKEGGAARRFVSPTHADRWVGTLDLCDDCRLVAGAHVTGWMFVPGAVTEPRIGIGGPQGLEVGGGTLQTFRSSEGVVRGFCGVCGATVLCACEERPGVVDVAVGVLRAPEGVAAEGWLTWRTGRVGYYESGERYDPVFAKALKEGFEEWGLKTYGELVNFKIG